MGEWRIIQHRSNCRCSLLDLPLALPLCLLLHSTNTSSVSCFSHNFKYLPVSGSFSKATRFPFFFSNHVQYLFFPFNFSNRRKHLLLNGSIVDFCNSYYGNYIKELEIKIIQIALLTLITCFGSANKWGVSYYSTWMFRSSRVPRHENWMRNMSRSWLIFNRTVFRNTSLVIHSDLW